jgi:hypothetical protein
MKLKNKLRLALCSLVVIFLGGCAVYQAAELANEVIDLRKHLPSERVWMDDWEKETWKSGYNVAQLNVDFVEYVHPPETVDNWTELLTMRVDWRTSKDYAHSGGVTFSVVPDPLVIMEATRISIQKRCANPVTFQKLDEDRAGVYPSVIFYYNHSCGMYPNTTFSLSTAEADVIRVFQGRYGLHTVMRARRSASLDDATLDEWTQYMKRFYLCDKSVPGQECGKNRS